MIVMSMLHLTKGVAVFCVLCFSLTYFVECDATDHLIQQMSKTNTEHLTNVLFKTEVENSALTSPQKKVAKFQLLYILLLFNLLHCLTVAFIVVDCSFYSGWLQLLQRLTVFVIVVDCICHSCWLQLLQRLTVFAIVVDCICHIG